MINMDLTISIVNWNVKEYLQRCLDSIFRYSKGIDHEVIVVDNASKDDSVNMVKKKFPQVILIESNENVGYGSAHNQAIKIARGKYILFLNPDTEMLPETLPKMLTFMETHPEAGGCGCREISTIEEIKSKEIIGLSKVRYYWWSLCRIMHKLTGVKHLTNYCLDFMIKARQSYLVKGDYKKILYFEGGFLLLRREALAQAGGFDPRIFLGDEGVDLTMRIRKQGWKLYLVNTIPVIHYGRKSSEQINDSEIMELERKYKERFK